MSKVSFFLTQDSRREIEKEISNAERDRRTLEERIKELKCTWVLITSFMPDVEKWSNMFNYFSTLCMKGLIFC